MSLITAAMAVFLLNSPASGSSKGPAASPAPLPLTQRLALLGGPSVNTTMGVSHTRNRILLSSLDRARFLEETRSEIYHENIKNPWEAFGLALLPTLFWKPISIAVAWKYCDKDEDKRYLAFLTAVPSSGC